MKKDSDAAQIINKAASFLGTKEEPEGSCNVIFNTDYYGEEVSDCMCAWCVVFLWDVFRMCGLSELFCDGMRTNECKKVLEWGKARGLLVPKEEGRYGDIVLFCWNEENRPEHMGLILEKKEDGSYTTIEGNTRPEPESRERAVLKKNRKIEDIHSIIRPEYRTRRETGKRVIDRYENILLLGCDVVDDVREREVLTEKQKYMRSDAMVVLSLEKKTGAVRLATLSRDMWVFLPKYGKRKLNAAVYFGGPELAMEVVNNSFQLNISKYVMINMNDMVELVDLLGGVDLEITDEEAAYIDEWMPDVRVVTKREDEVPPLNKGGMRHLNGMQTLAHVRNRTTGHNTLREHRIGKVLKILIGKVKSGRGIPGILMAAGKCLKYVKTNISIPEGLKLIFSVRRTDFSDVKSIWVPSEDTYQVKRDGTWRLEVNFMKAAIKLWLFLIGDPDK